MCLLRNGFWCQALLALFRHRFILLLLWPILNRREKFFHKCLYTWLLFTSFLSDYTCVQTLASTFFVKKAVFSLSRSWLVKDSTLLSISGFPSQLEKIFNCRLCIMLQWPKHLGPTIPLHYNSLNLYRIVRLWTYQRQCSGILRTQSSSFCYFNDYY